MTKPKPKPNAKPGKSKPAAAFGDAVLHRPPVPPWQETNGLYLAGQAEIDEADKTALEMEARWGCGRLRLMVGAELREKFDRQRYLQNQAIWWGDLEAVRRESRRMIAAWRALDRAATQAGGEPTPPEVWEVRLPDGTVAAIVREEAAAGLVQAQGRHVAVYALPEVGRLLAGFPALLRAKQIWPGATVESVREPVDPLYAIETTPLPIDEVPF